MRNLWKTNTWNLTKEQTLQKANGKVLPPKCDQHEKCSRPGGKGNEAGQLFGASDRMPTHGNTSAGLIGERLSVLRKNLGALSRKMMGEEIRQCPGAPFEICPAYPYLPLKNGIECKFLPFSWKASHSDRIVLTVNINFKNENTRVKSLNTNTIKQRDTTNGRTISRIS